MKALKMLGLAAAAVIALMAFVGTGTASSETTLCTQTATPTCTHPPLNETLEGVGGEGGGLSKPTLTAPFGNISCNSTIKGKIETTTTPESLVPAPSLAFTNCINGTAQTVTGGTIRAHHDGEHNGTTTFMIILVKVVQAGVTCYYESKDTTGNPLHGTFTGGTVGGTAFISITAEPTVIDTAVHDSSAFCPAHAPWHATYRLTAPAGKALYVGTT